MMQPVYFDAGACHKCQLCLERDIVKTAICIENLACKVCEDLALYMSKCHTIPCDFCTLGEWLEVLEKLQHKMRMVGAGGATDTMIEEAFLELAKWSRFLNE